MSRTARLKSRLVRVTYLPIMYTEKKKCKSEKPYCGQDIFIFPEIVLLVFLLYQLLHISDDPIFCYPILKNTSIRKHLKHSPDYNNVTVDLQYLCGLCGLRSCTAIMGGVVHSVSGLSLHTIQHVLLL